MSAEEIRRHMVSSRKNITGLRSCSHRQGRPIVEALLDPVYPTLVLKSTIEGGISDAIEHSGAERGATGVQSQASRGANRREIKAGSTKVSQRLDLESLLLTGACHRLATKTLVVLSM